MGHDTGAPPRPTGTRSALSADEVRAFTDRAPRCRVSVAVVCAPRRGGDGAGDAGSSSISAAPGCWSPACAAGGRRRGRVQVPARRRCGGARRPRRGGSHRQRSGGDGAALRQPGGTPAASWSTASSRRAPARPRCRPRPATRRRRSSSSTGRCACGCRRRPRSTSRTTRCCTSGWAAVSSRRTATSAGDGISDRHPGQRDQLLVRCRAKVAAKQDRWMGLRLIGVDRATLQLLRAEIAKLSTADTPCTFRCWSSFPRAVFGSVASRSRRGGARRQRSRWRRGGPPDRRRRRGRPRRARRQRGRARGPGLGRRRPEAGAAGQRRRRGSRRRGDGGARRREAGRQPRSGGADGQRGRRARVAAGGPPVAVGPPGSAVAVSGRRRRQAGGPRRVRVVFGRRRRREALLVLGVPSRARRGAVVARGRLTDPRVRRLARSSGAVADPPVAGEIVRPACGGGRARSRGSSCPPPGARAADALAQAARATMAAAGVLGRAGRGCPPTPSAARSRWSRRGCARARRDRRLPGDGLAPGRCRRARRWGAWCRAAGPALARAGMVDGLVVEASPAGPVRAGATLFMLLPVRGEGGARGTRARRPPRAPPRAATARRASAGSNTSRCPAWASIG